MYITLGAIYGSWFIFDIGISGKIYAFLGEIWLKYRRVMKISLWVDTIKCFCSSFYRSRYIWKNIFMKYRFLTSYMKISAVFSIISHFWSKIHFWVRKLLVIIIFILRSFCINLNRRMTIELSTHRTFGQF